MLGVPSLPSLMRAWRWRGERMVGRGLLDEEDVWGKEVDEDVGEDEVG